MYGEKRNAYRVMAVKQEGKRSQGRSIRGWKDNIKMDPRDIGWGNGLD
jgi:hypothetical protein